MLYAIDSGKYVYRLPHKNDFDRWMKNLSDQDYQNIEAALNQQINLHDINTSSWIPGANWASTPYQPIYAACGNDAVASGKFFGLILFNILMNRTDAVWGFGRFEKDGVPIRGTTYFILNNPPQSKF